MFVTIVLDGVGLGGAPDAAAYGDEGANTLACVCTSARPSLPHLTSLGLGLLGDFPGVAPVADPAASYGAMEAVSAGKDSTSGHWELAGIVLDQPFPTYPRGFPDDVVRSFLEAAGCEGVLANKPASGTEVIEEFGREHIESGRPILYTSADSVFQLAAHVEVTPLPQLYDWCRVAREQVCVAEHAVGRVIARPFRGEPGAFERLSDARRDYALAPPAATLQERLQQEGIRTVAVGKIGDLFAEVGFDELQSTKTNADGIEATIEAMQRADSRTFIWTNLVDFDQLFGHRNDPAGFARALEAFDRSIPRLASTLHAEGRLLITADHGNDPCFPGSDHTRERVPLILLETGNAAPRRLGIRSTFADHAASVAAHFGMKHIGAGASFI